MTKRVLAEEELDRFFAPTGEDGPPEQATGARKRRKSKTTPGSKPPLKAVAPKAMPKAAAKAAPPKPLPLKAVAAHWKTELTRTPRGNYAPSLANAISILRHDPKWAGVLAYDAFAGKVLKLTPAKWHRHDRPSKAYRKPGPWTDLDTTLLRAWLEREYEMQLKAHDAVAAVDAVAHSNPEHGPRDYLKKLIGTWDRTPRLDKWLVDYAGVRDTPYARAVSAMWMISAVARVFQPGCQVDHGIILEGAQGIGKSTLLRAITPNEQWFLVDIGSEFGKVDSFQKLRGKWIVEMSELDSLGKSALSAAKAYMTCPIDSYRKSYGRETADYPRTCVFAGTTNKDEYFTDDTGNRRFWPLLLAAIDRLGVVQIREQLWAEATARYLADEPWHISDPEILAAAQDEQEARLLSDPWARIVARFLSDEAVHSAGITTHQLLTTVLKIRPSDLKRDVEMRVAAILRLLKWANSGRRLSTVDGVRARRYFPGKGARKPTRSSLRVPGEIVKINVTPSREKIAKTLIENAKEVDQ